MKAIKVTIEFAFNNALEFKTYEDITVFSAMSKLKKEFGEVMIYNVSTQY